MMPSDGVILVIEDSDEDYEATVRALRAANVGRPLRRCPSSADALDFLFRRGKHVAAPPVALVLLDLNLPGTDGRVILDRIKTDDATRTLPVVVLTTSSSPRDIDACYRAGASSYVVKSVDFHQFVRSMMALAAYWFGAVALPPRKT